ncbi:19557_t:CDS:1, partial [Dentiscutata erythropus]
MQEKFNSLDTPDTYESRIRKVIVGFQDAIVIPALYTHLPNDIRSNVKMYMTIRGGTNQTIDNFFTDLKKCWIEYQ